MFSLPVMVKPAQFFFACKGQMLVLISYRPAFGRWERWRAQPSLVLKGHLEDQDMIFHLPWQLLGEDVGVFGEQKGAGLRKHTLDNKSEVWEEKPLFYPRF